MPAPSDFAAFVQSGVAARRHPRARFASTVRLRLPSGRLVEAHTRDISQGGLQLVVPANVPPGTVCGVQLLIPAIPFGVRTLAAQAQVTSQVFSGKESGFLIGLRFTSIPAASSTAIQAYLRERNAHHAYHGGASQPPVAQTGEPTEAPAQSPIEAKAGAETTAEAEADAGAEAETAAA